MKTAFDVEQTPESISDDDLITAIRGGKHAYLDRLGALKGLSRKKSPRLMEVLGEVLSNRSLPAEMRSTAALELGKAARPETQDLLLPGLSAEEPSVVNRVAATLGRIGNTKALEALESYEAPEGAALPRSVVFAQTLISYRLGLESHRLEPPSPKEVLKVTARGSDTLKSEALSAEKLKALAPNLHSELAGFDLAEEGALHLSCPENDFLLVPTGGLRKAKSLAELRRKNGLPIVVLKKSESLERYSLFEYILTQPGEGNQLLLIGVMSAGRPIHLGEIKTSARQTSFVLGSLNTPFAPLIEIEGTYSQQSKELKFTKANVSRERPQKQKSPVIPKETQLKVQ